MGSCESNPSFGMSCAGAGVGMDQHHLGYVLLGMNYELLLRLSIGQVGELTV